MFSYIVEQCFSFSLRLHKTKYTHVWRVREGKTLEVKWIKAQREDSIYASISPLRCCETFCRKMLPNNSLHSLLWFIMWWIISTSSPLFSFHKINQPFIHPTSFLFGSPIIFSIFIFHHLKMLFIEIYFVITFSYPPFFPRSTSHCWQWLSMAFFSTVESFFGFCFIHWPCRSRKISHTVYFQSSSKIYWPNYFCQFSPLRCFLFKDEGQKFTNLFTHRWINTFMRTDGYESKHKIPRYCSLPLLPENVHALCTNEPRIMQSI